MKNHEGCIRGYHRTSKAWYTKTQFRIEVLFGMYSLQGGTSDEMSMEWVEISNKLCPRLKCFDDSWSALALFNDLIQELGEVDNKVIQEEEFCKILDKCGFKDLTEYKRK